MSENRKILDKELAFYGIKVLDRETCQFFIDGKLTDGSISNKISEMINKAKKNIEVLEDVLEKIKKVLHFHDGNFFADKTEIKIFLHAMKEIDRFISLLLIDFQFKKYTTDFKLYKKTFKQKMNISYKDYSRDTILSIPELQILLDHIFRKINCQTYVARLLKLSRESDKKINMIKLSYGVQGPFSNLDLAFKERVFEWSDIEAEVRGRSRDIKKQQRYEIGLENYNNDGRVGEGFFWIERRNEPFLWSNREEKSPYPGRSVLMKS